MWEAESVIVIGLSLLGIVWLVHRELKKRP